MLNPGTILGNRYEIIGKIGTGGMADVYKGRDLKLNRFVAVKVLKAEYSSNKNFVSKFKVEAQSAAGLAHHNIVNVYDVGEENGLYYFVMELVEGITLKNYIEKKIRLSYKEALSIAIQVSNGIEAAHNNGIIHRDIKPQNIIISREGKVKVADFGIARAASSDTVTSHAMGSVHYTSPEQARGGYSDAKSDIYSIGITLFEMVTGRVPFDGETTVSIAIMHIQEEMPSPKKYVPDLPISVEKIIMKCTQKNPDRRYYNMGELIKDLKRACLTPDDDFVVIQDARSNAGTKVMTEADRSRVNQQVSTTAGQYMQQDVGYVKEQYQQPEQPGYGQNVQPAKPKNIYEQYAMQDGLDDDDDDEFDDGGLNGFPAGPSVNKRPQYDRQEPEYDDEDEDYEEWERQERLRKQEARRRKEEAKQLKKQSKQKNASRKNNDRYRDVEHVSRIRDDGRRHADSLDDPDVDPNMEKIMTILMIVAAIVIALIAIFAVKTVIDNMGGSGFGKQKVEEGYTIVPDVVGLDMDKASKALSDANLTANARYAESPEYDTGIICSQNIAAGEKVEEGTVLELVISSGKVAGAEPGVSVSVPDVVGRTEVEAKVALENDGFVMVKELVASDSVEKGVVVGQNPLGATNAPKGSEVHVMISDGPDTSESVVPDVVGKTKEEAMSMLQEAGFIFTNISEEANDAVEAGRVLSQTVAAGTTLTTGSTVDFTVSKGPVGYTFSYAIQPPADYLPGTEAIITLVDPSGNPLANVVTSTFPYQLVKDDIVGASSGALTVTYQRLDGSIFTTDPQVVSFIQN